MKKESNTEGSAESRGSTIKDIRQKAKKNPLFLSGLKKFANLNFEQLQRFLHSKQILKVIPGRENILLEREDMMEQFDSIWKSRSEFSSVDKDFEKHAEAYPRGPLPNRIKVSVYEMTENADMGAIFGSFGENLSLLCLTQDHILRFIRHHKEYLDRPTFFLFKSGANDATFEVAQVYLSKDGYLSIGLLSLGYECHWSLHPNDLRHVVVRRPLKGDVDVWPYDIAY